MTDTQLAFTGARLLQQTVEALCDRAPAIVAAAAEHLHGIRLGLHFNDGSHATLTTRHSRLIAEPDRCPNPDVEVVFQIQDDILNLIGEEALYGKEPLGDLLEGKRTVMLIHLFRTAHPYERPRLFDILRQRRTDKTQQHAEELLAAMHRHGSIEYATELADRLAAEGIARFEEDLQIIPENEGKAVLRQIAHYVTSRPL
ncbi:polyprenyl synthetase family protein [Streptomyces olivaceoviridis]|uniref:polyprenyl synthetase family protein n=1 Tax=Streptomyces olivaceoviridis TaxID=1921 RepID=UPI0036CC2993